MNHSIFPYGAVLKIEREFSLEDIGRALKSMKSIGMNTAVVWPAIYWWEDRKLPHYPFHTGREILRMAEELEMKIIMELEGQITCLEYAPDFLMKEEYYAIDDDGQKHNRDRGYYGFLNYNHPEVKELMRKSFSDAAQYYKGYKSLHGYDIYNETRFGSYDEYTLKLFREWLRRKYVEIERLNDSWERSYRDWSQIQFAWWTWASVMPSVDLIQFRRDNMHDLLKEWSGWIKKVDPGHVTIADNVYSTVTCDAHYNLPQDDWGVAESVDQFGISLYPKNNAVGLAHSSRWQTLTGVHSASRTGHFWISELQSHNVGIYNPFSVVHPHFVRWWNWEAISHGAKGIIYWKWEPFRKGIQTLGRGLVDIKGRLTVRAEEARSICKILDENKREFCSYDPEQPKVAILYDKLSHDFSKAYSRTHGEQVSASIYLDSHAGLYDVLWRNNVPSHYVIPKDIIHGTINRYEVLFITGQLNMSPELATALKKYVHQGGVVICDGRFGVVGDLGGVLPDMPGGTLHSTLGIDFLDIEGDDLKMNYRSGKQSKFMIDGFYERQILALTDKKVEVLGEFVTGSPAITRSTHGSGRIIFIGTYLWLGYHVKKHESVHRFLKSLVAEYSLALHSVSGDDLKIRTLKGQDGLILFVFNYGDKKARASIVLGDLNPGKFSVKNLQTADARILSGKNQGLKMDVSVPGRDVSIYKVSRVSSRK